MGGDTVIDVADLWHKINDTEPDDKKLELAASHTKQIEQELLDAAKCYVAAKEAGLNTNHRYRRLRRAWIVSVRS